MAINGSTTFQETQSLTRSAPSASTEGFGLKDITAVTLFAVANSTKTFSGGGTLYGWVYDTNVGIWARAPDLDVIPPSGYRAVCFGAFDVTCARNGRVLWATNAVTVSGGTDIDVFIVGQNPRVAESYS